MPNFIDDLTNVPPTNKQRLYKVAAALVSFFSDSSEWNQLAQAVIDTRTRIRALFGTASHVERGDSAFDGTQDYIDVNFAGLGGSAFGDGLYELWHSGAIVTADNGRQVAITISQLGGSDGALTGAGFRITPSGRFTGIVRWRAME